MEIMILYLRLNQTQSPVLRNCQKCILKITGCFCITAILFTDNCYGSLSLKEEPQYLVGKEYIRIFYISSPDASKKSASRPGPFKLWK